MIGIGIGVPFNFSSPIDADAQIVYNRIIADGGVSDLTRLNFFVKGLKTIYGSLTNVPVCYDAHWIGYKLGSGTGATAGQAAAKLYSLTVAADAVQTTAASQPLLLAHNGASSDNYWWGSGVSGNFVSTPNAAAQTLVNEFEFKGFINTRNLATYGVLVNKQSGNGYQFYLRSTGVLGIYAPGIATSIESTVGLTLNTDIYFKINRAAGSSNFIFYSSTDGISYTQLGATVVVNSNNFTTSTQPFIVGGDGAIGGFLGRIYRLTISNSIGGTPVVDFNTATYNAATSQTAWTSATGEVWTINTGTATTGYKGVLVDRTIVMSDGINDGLLTASNLSVLTNFSYYASIKGFKGPASGKFIDAVYTKQFGITVDSTVTNFEISAKVTGGAPYGVLKTFVSNTFLLISTTRISSTGVYSVGINDASYTNSTDGVAGATVADKLAIFQSTAATQFGQNIVNTFILASQTDTPAQRTATYNLIRSLNNNAF